MRDLLATQFWKDNWFLNNGSEQFVRGSSLFGTYSGPIYAVDVDRDGDLDESRRGTSSRLGYFENINGQFSERSIASNVTVSPNALSAADLDGDGDLDLLSIANLSGNNVLWYENDGRGYYTERVVGSFGVVSGALLEGDVDGDGDMDVVVSNLAETSWYENDGQQSFSRHQALSHGGNAALADMDGDGRLDIVMASPATFAGASSQGLAWYSLTDRQASLALGSPSTVSEESGEELVITFSREGHLEDELAVGFSLSGRASYAIDYDISGASTTTAIGGTVIFPANVSSVQIRLKPLDDAIKELDETVQIELVPVAGVGFFRAAVTAKITSNEIAGNYNDDGLVDGADFLLWQRGLGEIVEPPGAGADGDIDGVVDSDDLNQIWKVDFGRAAAPAVEAAAAQLAAVNDLAVRDALWAAFTEYQTSSSKASRTSLSRAGYRPRPMMRG